MTSYILGGANKVFNPSFEVNTTGWITNGGNLTLDTVNKWSGLQSGRLTVTSTASNPFISTPNTNADSRKIPVTPGGFVAADFRAIASKGTLSGRARIAFYTSGNVLVGSVFDGIAVPISNVTFTEISITDVEVPATAAYAIFYARIELTNLAVSDWVAFDGLDFRYTPTVDTYIDGAQGSSYGWTGTPHDSPSYRNAVVATQTKGRRGSVRVTARLLKADKLNNLTDDISDYIVDGRVEMKSDRDIKMTFKGQLTDPTIISPYTDYIAPFMRLEYSDGSVIDEQIGLYSVEPFPETTTETMRIGEFDGRDLTWNLSQSAFSGRYSLPAGASYDFYIGAILASDGFTRFSIPASGKTLPKAITWVEDASKLKIINDLLSAIGYYSLSMDRQGVLTSFPFRSLKGSEPDLELMSGEDSTIIGAIRKEPITSKIYNMVKITKEDTTNKANSFSITRYNNSGTSPVSIPNLKRRIMLPINDSKIESQTVAEEMARKIIEEAASMYTNYTITTLPDPRRGLWEVYNANVFMKNGTEVLTGKLWADGWDIGFTPTGAIMNHYVHRLEDYE